jgi:hypothetical protein
VIDRDPTPEECEQVAELLRQGLQRGDAAAALFLTSEQFDQMFVAGCAPSATKMQRAFSKMVIDEENAYKAKLIRLASTSKSTYGPLALLQTRFKQTWGKDAKPQPEAIPNNLIDWDKALDELLAQDDSPLHALLKKHGFERAKKRK